MKQKLKTINIDSAKSAHKHWNHRKLRKTFPEAQVIRNIGFLKNFIHESTPNSPFISKDTKVMCFGKEFSCIVNSFLEYIKFQAINTSLMPYAIPIADVSLYSNAPIILQQLELGFENNKPIEHVWYDDNINYIDNHNDMIIAKISESIKACDVFVITLTNNEVWQNHITQDFFLRAVPADCYNADIHQLKILTVSENINYLDRICNVIDRHNPNAHIIFATGCLPEYTDSGRSIILADSYNNSVLHAAVCEFVNTKSLDSRIHYWPFRELVKFYFDKAILNDNKTIKSESIIQIMDLFNKYYIKR